MKYISKSEKETENIAAKIAKNLNSNDIIVLTGDLGAGKTKFVYGVLKYFGIEGQLSSPTFTLVNEYTLGNNGKNIDKIYHFDVYRLKDVNEFIDSIGTDYFDDNLCIIEWGEMLKDILPERTIYISIKKLDENSKGYNENSREIEVLEK